jgi:hypothetical protein
MFVDALYSCLNMAAVFYLSHLLSLFSQAGHAQFYVPVCFTIVAGIA